MLSHTKGKKAIPRAFRQVTPEQRTIITTMIVLNLDSLDVVHNALVNPIPASVKEDIELFINSVVPCLHTHINEAPLSITLGLLGLILDRCDLRSVSRTKIGLIILTLLISRAELLRESYVQSTSSTSEQNEWRQYTSLYTALFTAIEPLLPHIFPDSSPMASDDVYVWQFLAAMGVAANAEQQQRLVLGVKDRVMSAVGAARTLPGVEKERRLGEVNLFMAALGLDVEMLA
jgi:DNA topoisomerase 2-associated protein PAT1